MITASYRTLAIVTCSGSVYVLAQDAAVRGVNGGRHCNCLVSGNFTTSSGNPVISNIVACRVSYNTAFALGSDGSFVDMGYTNLSGRWFCYCIQNKSHTHDFTYLQFWRISQNDFYYSTRSHPTPSYFVLSSDNNLYAVGENSFRQLGDWTTTDRTSWVQPRYTSSSGPVMNNIKWIAANENDAGGSTFGAINVLTTELKFITGAKMVIQC